jgi:Protein of unknown function (DUF1236)
MRVLRSAAFGCALALGAAGAHAQSVISRQIDNAPVETIVTQTPNGTVITRRPVAAAPVYPVAPAAPTYVDETVGAAPRVETMTVRQPAETRTTTRTSRVVHHARSARESRTVTRTVRRATRRIAAQPLVLDPAQRQVVYRTIVQQQVVPLAPAGYPAFPPPAYQPRTVVVAPSATTGYALTPPPADLDDVDVEQIPPAAPLYRTRTTIGSVLPADIALAPLPATAALRVPSVQPYSYATVDGRVLLVDPVTNAVVADITP